MGGTREPRIRPMIGFMRAMRSLVAVAVLSIALQPCLACAQEPERPAVRPAEACHGATHQVAAACPDVRGVELTVAPGGSGTVGIPALPPATPEALLHPLRSAGDGAIVPAATAAGPPLWLRHASLRV